MFFWKLEIKEINSDSVTLIDGSTIPVTEKNKLLFTENEIGGSELQQNMVKVVATEFLAQLPADLSKSHESITAKLMDILDEHNMRLVDISEVWETIISHLITIKSELDNTISAKNDETIVKLVWKDKLDNFSKLFGATENAPSNSIRNIRIKDIFLN